MPKRIWAFKASDTFRELYRSKDDQLRKRAKDLINLMAVTENPITLGSKKKNLEFWAAEIGYDSRLAYNVDFPNKTIELLKVCSHQEVYGKKTRT